MVAEPNFLKMLEAFLLFWANLVASYNLLFPIPCLDYHLKACL